MRGISKASIFKGAKKTWSGRSKKGNLVVLSTKKGVKGIKAVRYNTKNGPRWLVITERVYEANK